MTKKHITVDERPAYTKRLARRIQRILKQYDLGISELAREVGIPPPTFWSWAKGNSCPNNITLYRKVMSELAMLDATREKLQKQQQLMLDRTADQPVKEKQLDLDWDFQVPEPTTGIADAEPVRVNPNDDLVLVVQDKLLILPRADVLAIISYGLNKFMGGGVKGYEVTDLTFDGKSGQILFTGGDK